MILFILLCNIGVSYIGEKQEKKELGEKVTHVMISVIKIKKNRKKKTKIYIWSIILLTKRKINSDIYPHHLGVEY